MGCMDYMEAQTDRQTNRRINRFLRPTPALKTAVPIPLLPQYNKKSA